MSLCENIFENGGKPLSLDFISERDIFAYMKTGYASIIGEPNVGKSTLMNRLVGRNISITTKKPQTTRNRIAGIWTKNSNKIIFLDTPGQFNPGNEMEKAMQNQIKSAIDDADIMLFMVDHRINPEEIELPQVNGKPFFLIINKIDLLSEKDLNILINRIDKQCYTGIFTISALRGDNDGNIIPSLLEFLPEGPPLYPEDYLSDRPERFFIEEFVREQILQEYSQEIPYSSAVKVESMDGNKIDIKIFVERESQKGIIIGKGGKKLKKVVSKARKRIEDLIGEKVYMTTWVAVKKNWRKAKNEVKRLGYYE